MLTLDDFVMLGTTVPEPSKRDDRIMVCSAGYSATLRSLVRVYPLSRFGAPARWSVNNVALERNPDDSRIESFKLAGDRSPEGHPFINRLFVPSGVVPKANRADLLRKCAVESIAEANARDNRLSLAIIHPNAMEVEFEHNPASPDSPQLALFDLPGDPPSGARRFPFIPRLRFRDADGSHRLMLRDWGVYELMRKTDEFAYWSDTQRRDYMTGALRLDPSCSLLVGNLSHQRNAWLVISVLRGLRNATPALFDLTEVAA
jgi:hypothetical protein